MEHQLLTSSYIGELDKFVADLIRYEEIIERWELSHPEYNATVESDIDDGEFYTIRVICRKR